MRVYNGGTYDLLHSGHLNMLRHCRELAGPNGEVVIGLNTDEFVLEFKGHLPVQSYMERSEVLAACRFVDRVVPNVGGRDSRVVLESVLPDVILASFDYWSEDHSKYCAQMGFSVEWLAARHIRLEYLMWRPEISSSHLRAIAGANRPPWTQPPTTIPTERRGGL